MRKGQGGKFLEQESIWTAAEKKGDDEKEENICEKKIFLAPQVL